MAQETPSTHMSAPHAADVQVFSDAAALADAGARHFARRAAESVLRQGRFTVALSGGSTPRALLALLAAEPYKTSVPWQSVYFFWGDERDVPPDHAESNYKMAHDALLSHVPVPPGNVFRIRAELGAERAAAEYSAELRSFFSLAGPDDLPRFDLVFLGMGADGHTASLFPGTTALKAGREIAVATWVEKLQARRVTLTAAAINNAAEVLFLVAGRDKAATLEAVLGGAREPEEYPSRMIAPTQGALLWFVDAAASAGLRLEE
jgi:6-phosphogluconolactonase